MPNLHGGADVLQPVVVGADLRDGLGRENTEPAHSSLKRTQGRQAGGCSRHVGQAFGGVSRQARVVRPHLEGSLWEQEFQWQVHRDVLRERL